MSRALNIDSMVSLLLKKKLFTMIGNKISPLVYIQLQVCTQTMSARWCPLRYAHKGTYKLALN